MSIYEFEPDDDLIPLDIMIWIVEVEAKDDIKSYIGQNNSEYYISIGQRALGLLHWEISGDGRDGYIDGIDPQDGIDEQDINPAEWEAIVISMHGLTKQVEQRHVAKITYPNGTKVFFEAVQ